MSIELLETVNARGPSLDEFPAEPEVVASAIDCRGISIATLGRLTAGISVATVGRLTAGRRDATGGRLVGLRPKGFRLLSWVDLRPEEGMLP